MSFRIEEKLYIKSEHILDFKEFLTKRSAKQLYQPRRIKSLYFDNLNYDMYNDSIEGMVPRKKIRIREYPNTSDKNFYLEIKNSSVEGRFKTRKILDNKKLDYYKKAGVFDGQYGVCLPNFYVSYEREYSIIDDVRISIDKNLVYESYRNNNVCNDDNSIVEIKTSINKNLDDLIELFPFQRTRFSKYCFAVDSLKL
jgi:SPX domain protein involved in polyphosphate accumulation